MLGHDVRYALRSLRAQPAFTLIALATLALGIGANVAIFTVVHSILLRPLPFPQPEQVVRLYQAFPARDVTRGGISRPDFEDWAKSADTVAAMGLTFFRRDGMVLLGDGEPVELATTYVVGDFFAALGVEAAIGRTLDPADDPDDSRQVVISDRLWRGRLGQDPEVVGRRLVLDAEPFTVVGVMPPSFRVPEPDTDVWTFASVIPAASIPFHLRVVRILDGVARLRPGADPAAAQAELSALARGLETAHPNTNAGTGGVTVVPYAEDLVGPVRPALLLLLAAVAAVLLVACANVANLLLARGVARRRELAVRTALGASRGRLVRQQLVESLLLALAGGVLGLGLAVWGVELLVGMAGELLPRGHEIAPGGAVLAFAVALAAATGVVFGAFPAWRAARPELTAALGAGGRSGPPAAAVRLRRLLVVAEVAVAMVLAVGTGLLVKSFWRLVQVDPGFNAERLLAVELTVPDAIHPEREQYLEVYRRMMAEVAAVPGVTRVASIKRTPLVGRGERMSYTVADQPPPAAGETPVSFVHPASPGLLRTLEVPLVAGRDLRSSDHAEAPLVVVVSQALARRHWGDASPLGRHLQIADLEAEIVGVAGDVKDRTLGAPPVAAVYIPQEQMPRRVFTLLVRTEAAPATLMAAVRDAIRAVEPRQPITRMTTMEAVVAGSLGQPRFITALLTVFGVLALVLAAIGLYGVIAFVIGQRRREISVRLALGADRGDVVAMVLGQGLSTALAGVALGTLGALALSQLLRGQLYGIGPRDPATFAAVAALLLAVAAAASWLPARRAARVAPSEALR